MVIHWSPTAIESLHSVFDFYAAEAGCEKAHEIVADIRRHTLYLHVFPRMGAYEQGTAYRYLVIRRCKVFYDIIDDETILIVLVWDTRRDPQRLKAFLH